MTAIERKAVMCGSDCQSRILAPTQSRRTTLPNALKAELQKILLRHAIMEGMMHLGQLFHVANTTRLAIPLRPREWLEDRRTRMENGLKTLARAARNGTISGGTINTLRVKGWMFTLLSLICNLRRVKNNPMIQCCMVNVHPTLGQIS